jgi:RNA ligase (TIGR02306 family)
VGSEMCIRDRSQGLLLNLDSVIPQTNSLAEGDDVSELLGVIKWEKPMNAQLAGVARGNFPSQIPKTDQERAQNLKSEIAQAAEDGLEFEVTEKLEGSSMTVYLIDGEFGVCSRNLDLKETEDNTFWQVARRDSIEAKMRAVPTGGDFAIQGELIGPGIQGNIYKLSKPEFRVFDVYNISGGFYMNPAGRRDLIEMMGLLHVPVMLIDKDLGIGSVEEILQWADAQSVMGDITGPWREGIVFKQVDGGMTFKAISNKYLLGEK